MRKNLQTATLTGAGIAAVLTVALLVTPALSDATVTSASTSDSTTDTPCAIQGDVSDQVKSAPSDPEQAALLTTDALTDTASTTQLATASSVAEPSADTASSEAGADAVITAGGTYHIASPLYHTTITVNTTEPVTLVGDGIDATGSMYLTIECTAGVDLTLRDVAISNGTSYAVPALSFTGTNNHLHLEGQSFLQMCYTAPGAAPLISVPSGTKLTIDGEGELYLYRHTTESATFGGADSCDNGSVTIAGGHLRITGMSGGCAFGTSYPDGDFTITGGDVSIEVEKGQAGIAGGATSGNVIVKGGTLTLAGAGTAIYADPADGEGTLQIQGGRLVADTDTLPQAFDTAGTALLPCAVDLSDVVSGSEATILVDGEPYYSGTLNVAHLNDVQDPRGESTPKTWTTTCDTDFTVWLTPENHVLTVNGTTRYANYRTGSGFTVSDQPSVPLSATVSTTPVQPFGLATFACTTNAEDATYQWQYLRAGGTTWQDLPEWLQPGSTTSTFAMEACTCRLKVRFRCVVTTPDGETITSDEIGFDLAGTA